MRRLLIHSMLNMRDLGGYATLRGGMTQWMRFIRSDAFMRPSAEDINALKDAGLVMAIDLREAEERAKHPSAFADVPGIEYLNICFADDPMHAFNPKADPPVDYVALVTGQNRLTAVFEAIAGAPEGAVLFHCSAGKDRTGIVAALLLMLAEVPVPDIVADYSVTHTYIRDALIERFQLPDDKIILTMSKPEWIWRLIDHVNAQGGAARFLMMNGLSNGQIEVIKKRIVG